MPRLMPVADPVNTSDRLDSLDLSWPIQQSSPEKRRILLLQGLMGPLFRRLGQGLRAAGHEVHKVNFNGGDRLYWRLPNGIDYRRTLEEWPAALAEILADRRISDVILFG